MRRSVQPNRPSAMTWCFFASLKRLAIRRRDHGPCRRVNVLSAYSLWPVFSCPRMAGFGCPPRRTPPWRDEQQGGDGASTERRSTVTVVNALDQQNDERVIGVGVRAPASAV